MIANTNPKKRPSFGLVLAGLAIGALAQGVLLFPWGRLLDGFYPVQAVVIYTLTGILLYVLAGILFTVGIRRQGDSLTAFDVNTNQLPERKPRFVFWFASLGMATMIAIYASRALKDDTYGYLFAGMWIFSILVMVLGVLEEQGWRPPAMTAARDWFKAHRAELFVVTAIVLVAFLIRFVDIELFPYSFNNDEGHMGSGGECILQGACKNFFVLDWAAQPEPAFFMYAISIGLFGKTALAVRLVSVITGTLAVAAVYLLAREIFDKKVAWLSAVLLSTLPVHVHFSRIGVDNIIDSLTAPLILWLLFRGAKRASRLSFLAAGIVAGLCLYTYPGSLLAPVFGVGALGLLALQRRGFLQTNARNIVIFVLAAVVVVTPILGHYSTHPDFFLARFKKEGIFQSGGLQKEMQNRGKSAAEILVRQFSRSSLVFIATGAPYNFFNSPSAYFPPFEAVIFMFGLAYVIWRIKDLRFTILMVWFWAVVILGSALTGSPPTSQRILMSLPAAVLITALGMTKILQAFAKFRPSVVKFAPAILLASVLYIGVTNINFYFHDYRIRHYYEDPKDEISYETRFYTQPLETQGRMFLIADHNTPYLRFESFNYFAPNMEKIAYNNITFENLRTIRDDKDALFIALPDYKSDLELVAQLIPGGEWREVRRRYQPEYTLFYSYTIPRERLMVFTKTPYGYNNFGP